MISNRNEEGIARIGDFGFSTRVAPGEKLTGILGTLGYMAPEMVQGHAYDQSIDIWSFGILLYNLFTLNSEPFLTAPNASYEEILRTTLDT